MERRALLLVLLLPLACGTGDLPGKPNLLLVTIDTLRRDAVGCYGAAGARTPAFDRLAREGVLLANASAFVPITLPSHATLFTGRYPAQHGSRHNGTPLPLDETTLAERLSAHGYRTAGFAASQVLARAFQIDQGFETYEDRWENPDRGLHGLLERRADSVASSFLQWLEGRETNEPFFAFLHFYDPHAPYEPPPPFAEAAGDGYAGEAAYADLHLGLVLDSLERRGLLENTVVVVLSDHGEGLGEHGESEHGILLYETTLAIPWVFRLPDGPRGRIVAAPTETVDLLPTLAALLGIEADPDWPGRSLLPLFDGREEEAERPLFGESLYGNIGYGWAPLRSVRFGGWKLVRGSRDELFDLANDPRETESRAGSEPEIVRELGARIEARVAEEPAGYPAAPDLTMEQREMLESLGYAAPRSAGEAGGDLPDPRDRFLAHELVVRARVRAKEGRRDQARQDLEEALRIDPKNVDAMLRLAQYYRELGRIEKERGLYLTILSVDPDHAPAWNNLGSLAETEGDLDSALRCYERSIQGSPGFADPYVNRGNVYYARGKLPEAMREYDKALELNPGAGIAHYGKAMVYNRWGDFERVVQELKLAVRVDPSLREASEWLAALERSARSGI
ncbi:MAG: sulfatase-like hydrolase/transferase [Candidatus Eisenbacteria bacterium]